MLLSLLMVNQMTEKQAPSLTKTCSICGELKPLSAFLQMSETKGAEYGSVCSDCRKKGADKPRVPESDETTQSSSGRVIDSKTKLQMDTDKRELVEQTELENYEERELTETEKKLENTKIENKMTQEKQARQTFLNRSVLSGKKPTAAGESRWRVDQATQQGNVEATQKLDKAAKDELNEKGLDQGSVDDLRFGEKLKHGVGFKQGAAFNEFAKRLGKHSGFMHKATDQKPDAAAPTISEEMENKWGPGKKR